MNTQLKKGDKCQSPWGEVTVYQARNTSDIVAVIIDGSDGIYRMIHTDELTRIPSHAERMQAMLDIAWDVENRLEDDETVQLKVGEFVEFARHYYELKQQLVKYIEVDRRNGKAFISEADAAEKLLKGEP
jgi:hypothetical protein